MARTETKPKTIFYKRAQFLNKCASLENQLSTALTRHDKVAERHRALSEHADYQVLNHHKKTGGMICGEVVLYSKDMRPMILAAADGASEFEFEELEIQSKKKDGKVRELLESVLYFGVMDDHVVVAQSSALKARDLENYLNWLLGEHTGILGVDNRIGLIDCPTKKTREKLKNNHVKSVKVGAPLEVETKGDSDHGTPLSKSSQPVKGLTYVPVGTGFSLLRAAFGEDWFNRLKLEDALDEANLQVRLEIRYLRKTTESAQKMLDNLAIATRHMEPEDTTIYFEGGGELKGEDLKMFSRENIRATNGRIDREDMFGKMVEFLQTRLASGLIDG